MSCCFGPKGVSSNDDTKALSLCEIHFLFIITSRPLNHQRINNQRNNLLYNDVENKTSILTCCFGPKCVSSNDDRKALFLCEIHFSLTLTSGPLNHQRTNNQHITIVYNEMKSLSSIFRCCVGPKGVSSRKALFPYQLHFSPYITSRSLNNQRTNKQLITFLHNSEEFHFQLLQWYQHCTFKESIVTVR